MGINKGAIAGDILRSVAKKLINNCSKPCINKKCLKDVFYDPDGKYFLDAEIYCRGCPYKRKDRENGN